MWRIIVSLIVLPFSAFSQEESGQYIDRGLLRAQGNIAMGKPSNGVASNFYIAGDLEYYTSNSISVKGSSNFYLGSSNGDGAFSMNHSILLGGLYHFRTKGNFDLYIGIEPGFSMSQLADSVKGTEAPATIAVESSNAPITVNPIFSTTVGFNYFANKYFSLFANVRLVQGKHYSNVKAVSLNEVKFAFGLGWHLWARKGYIKFKKPETP